MMVIYQGSGEKESFSSLISLKVSVDVKHHVYLLRRFLSSNV